MNRKVLENVAKMFRKSEEKSDEHGDPGVSDGQREILGELYLQVHDAIKRESTYSPIASIEAFAMTVGRKEYPRIYWRERRQADKHTPTQDNSASNLESGVAIDLLRHSSDRTPMDEVIHREECQTLLSILNKLSETDRQLLWSLPHDCSKGRLCELARKTGRSVRTLQRRRKELQTRIRDLLDS